MSGLFRSVKKLFGGGGSSSAAAPSAMAASKPALVMPDEEDIKRIRRRTAFSLGATRKGRASTILSDRDDMLGP